MPREKAKKTGWLVVSARIPPDLKNWILQKHKKDGSINDLIHVLLQRYKDGRIFGVKLES